MDCVILFRKEPDGLPADGGSSDSAGSLQTLLWQTLSADNQTTLMDTAMIVWLLWLMVDGCCWCWWSGQHSKVSFLTGTDWSQRDAAQLSVVLDLFCLKREGCDGTLRWKAVLEYVRMISSLTLHFRSHFKEHEIMSKNSWVQFEKVKEDESLSHRSRRCWTRTHKLNSDWSMLSLNTVHTTTLSWS